MLLFLGIDYCWKIYVFFNDVPLDEINELEIEDYIYIITNVLFFRMAQPWKKPRHQGKASTSGN
jgi:hypothetical protein